MSVSKTEVPCSNQGVRAKALINVQRNELYFETFIIPKFIKDLENKGMPDDKLLKLIQSFTTLGDAFILRPVKIIDHLGKVGKEEFTLGILYEDDVYIKVEVSENKCKITIKDMDGLLISTYLTEKQAYELIKET